MEPAKLKVKIRFAEVEGDSETLARFIGPIVAAPKRPARKTMPSAPITDHRSQTQGSTP